VWEDGGGNPASYPMRDIGGGVLGRDVEAG